MKKTWIYIFGIIILAIAVFFYLNSGEGEEIRKPTTGDKIILFGDSLAQGVGSTPGNDVAVLLSQNLGQEVINAGISGDTTRTALARVDNEVLSQNPKIVIIILGGNDFLLRMPKAETIENLRQIIEKIQNKDAGVVLVGVRKIIYSSDYKTLAEETGSAYVSNLLDETYGKKDLMSDQIHPNDAGYKIFAEKIAPAVRDLLD